MIVALEARYPCTPCGYVLQLVVTATARVNKRSVVVQAFLGVAPRPCPECWSTTPPPDRPDYQVTPDARQRIDAVRLRRWPELALEVAA